MKNRLEMVQHNAAKFVSNKYPRKGHYGDFSISELISELEWDSLEERREQLKLNMVYKILNGKVILSPDSLPRLQESTTLVPPEVVTKYQSGPTISSLSLKPDYLQPVKHFTTLLPNFRIRS